VQPESLARADVGDGRHRVHARGRRRADGGDDGQRDAACRAIVGDRPRERVGAHAELCVRRDLPQRLVAEAEQDDRLVDRRVRLLGAVDAVARQVAARPCRRRARPARAASRAAASACSVEIDAVS
jgi:hypothetical protein